MTLESPSIWASLRRWQEHRCIPLAAKSPAVLSMVGSMTFVLLFADLGVVGIAATASVLWLGALFVLRAPSYPSGRPEDCTRPLAAAAIEARASEPSPVARSTSHNLDRRA
ncbi:MAG: DUF454 domain-containing protein [Myxococcales bacterium]|nr:DUF454 domain-containing protein [Myxococcales bacterium]